MIDATDLEGDVDFELSWNPQPLSYDLPGRLPLFAALSNKLGLKLEPARAPVEIVVVDHIDRPTPD